MRKEKASRLPQAFLLIDEVQINAIVKLIADAVLRVGLACAINQHAVLQDKQGIGRARDVRVKRARAGDAIGAVGGEKDGMAEDFRRSVERRIIL